MNPLDIYAFTNPALCAATIWAFLQGHVEATGDGCDFSLIFIPLPIVLSDSTNRSFEHTTIGTGLYSWLVQHPDVAVGLSDKITSTASFTRQGLIFALQNNVVSLSSKGLFTPAREGLKADPRTSTRIDGSLKSMWAHASRLGGWIGQINSTSHTLAAFGITP
jgi:Family of unknown function (DUF6521)